MDQVILYPRYPDDAVGMILADLVPPVLDESVSNVFRIERFWIKDAVVWM